MIEKENKNEALEAQKNGEVAPMQTAPAVTGSPEKVQEGNQEGKTLKEEIVKTDTPEPSKTSEDEPVKVEEVLLGERSGMHHTVQGRKNLVFDVVADLLREGTIQVKVDEEDNTAKVYLKL